MPTSESPLRWRWSPFAATTPADGGAPVGKVWQTGTLTYTSRALVFLFGWLLLGDLVWNIKERVVSPLGQLLLRDLSATDLLVGLLTGSVPAALGMVFGPWIGVMSDRHRGRWGRRLPFLFWSMPIAVAALAGLAFAPWLGQGLDEMLGARSPGLHALRIGVFALFWTVFEAVTVTSTLIFGGLINDVVPSAVMGRFFGMFRAVGLLPGILFNFFIFGHTDGYYPAIFLGVGALYAVGFSLMCFNVKEGRYSAPPTDFQPADGLLASMRVYGRECFGHRYYLCYFLGFALLFLAPVPINSFSIFQALSLNVSKEAYGEYLAITYCISLLLAPFLGALADRFHPLRVVIGALGLYMLAMLAGGFCAMNPAAFAIAFIVHGVLAGVILTTGASLGQRLLPASKYTQYSSAAGIFLAAGNIATPALVGALLDFTGHHYLFTFFASSLLAAAGCVMLLIVHSQFMKLGGPKNYTPP